MKTKGNETFKLSEVAQRHPLLRTESLDGVLTYWPQKKNSYLLANHMPMINENTDRIVVDMHKASRGGMTPMVHMNASTPIHDPSSGRGRREFEAATFREKVHLDQSDIYDLRRIGTQEEWTRAQQLIQRRVRDLEVRLANRMEWLRRQVLFDGTVTAELEDGTEFSVQYNHPDYLEPTAGTLWSNDAAEPIEAFSEVLDQFEADTGRSVSDIYFPHGLLQELISNTRFRELAKQNLDTFRGSKEEIRRMMVDILGVGNIQISKDWMQFQTDLEIDEANGDNTLKLRGDTSQITTDTVLFVVSAKDQVRERFTIASVDHDTRTVTTNETIARTGGFHAGDPVKYRVPIIPEDRILIFGQFGPIDNDEGDIAGDVSKIESPDNWGQVVSTRSYYADMDNPRPGLYTRTIDKTQADPPHIEQILGIRALPRVMYNDAWMTYKVR